jgi:hypothetical protein
MADRINTLAILRTKGNALVAVPIVYRRRFQVSSELLAIASRLTVGLVNAEDAAARTVNFSKRPRERLA